MTPCTHFGVCGGCSLQDLSSDAYRDRKRDMVAKALSRVGLCDVVVKDPLLSQQKSRRRAVFKFGKERGHVSVGFHAARSHAIADMHECLVLTKPLLAFAATLRRGLAPFLAENEKGEAHVSETGTGFDLAFRWRRKLTPVLTAAIAKAFAGADIARIIFNGEIVLERGKPQIMFDGVTVTPPPHAFLQATREGEVALQSHASWS